jgi:hypothetical protein
MQDFPLNGNTTTQTPKRRRNNDENEPRPLIDRKISGMIAIPASLGSNFIHIAGMPIHIAPEYTIHIIGIRTIARWIRRRFSFSFW